MRMLSAMHAMRRGSSRFKCKCVNSAFAMVCTIDNVITAAYSGNGSGFDPELCGTAAERSETSSEQGWPQFRALKDSAPLKQRGSPTQAGPGQLTQSHLLIIWPGYYTLGRHGSIHCRPENSTLKTASLWPRELQACACSLPPAASGSQREPHMQCHAGQENGNVMRGVKKRNWQKKKRQN